MRRTRLSCEILRRAQFVLIMKVGEVDKCDAKTFALLRIKYLEEAPATRRFTHFSSNTQIHIITLHTIESQN